MQRHYIHIVIIQCSQCCYAYSHYNAAIYGTDTVPHCIMTLCSQYTVSLCSINTESLISLNYTAYTVSLYMQTMSLYSVHMQYQSLYTVYTFSL